MKRDKNINLIRAARPELEKLGYKPLIGEKAQIENGDMVCLSKEETLWAEMDSAKAYRKALKLPRPPGLVLSNRKI